MYAFIDDKSTLCWDFYSGHFKKVTKILNVLTLNCNQRYFLKIGPSRSNHITPGAPYFDVFVRLIFRLVYIK